MTTPMLRYFGSSILRLPAGLDEADLCAVFAAVGLDLRRASAPGQPVRYSVMSQNTHDGCGLDELTDEERQLLTRLGIDARGEDFLSHHDLLTQLHPRQPVATLWSGLSEENVPFAWFHATDAEGNVLKDQHTTDLYKETIGSYSCPSA